MTILAEAGDLRRFRHHLPIKARGTVTHGSILDENFRLSWGRSQRKSTAYVERYNRTVRHELLDLHIFETIDEE